MEENQDLVEKYMGTVSDGFVMVVGAIVLPIAFVAKSRNARMKSKRVIQ